jgi:hypothetical protein
MQAADQIHALNPPTRFQEPPGDLRPIHSYVSKALSRIEAPDGVCVRRLTRPNTCGSMSRTRGMVE